MQINKKNLSIAFILSLHGTALCMEETKLELQPHTETVAHYMAEKNSEMRKQNILPFAEWITAKRNVYHNDKDWNEFCENNHKLLKFSIRKLSLFKATDIADNITENMRKVILDRVHKLESSCKPDTLANTIDQDLLVLYHACAKSENS